MDAAMPVEPTGLEHIDETVAWCTIPLTAGGCVRTNAYGDYDAGSRFVAVDDPSGEQLAWWSSETWGASSDDAAAFLRALAAAASADSAWDDLYDTELVVALSGGALHICPEGTYVRLVDADGDEVDDGSAYWTCDEIAHDPELVVGAVLGAAAQLADRLW